MTLEIANRLVELRRGCGMSQEELADKLGISRQAVSKWERAEASPDTDNLIALAALYGVTLDELIHGDVPAAQKEEAASPEPDDASAVDGDPIDPDNPLPNGSFYDYMEDKRRANHPLFRKGVYPCVVALIYLVLGAMFGLWHPAWLLFLTVPLAYLPASHRTPLRLLANPVMITLIYLLLGFYCNLWHPGWLVFLAIPVLGAVAWRE